MFDDELALFKMAIEVIKEEPTILAWALMIFVILFVGFAFACCL